MKRITCLHADCGYQPWFPDGLCRRHGLAAGSDMPITEAGFVADPVKPAYPSSKSLRSAPEPHPDTDPGGMKDELHPARREH